MRHRSQRGFGIIAAIVILVIMAALATFITVLSTTQNVGTALDVNGARAYSAALSGSEWGLYRAIRDGNCAGSTTLAETVNGMTVTVTCQTVATGNATEAGLGTIYRIVATACNVPVGGNCPGDASSPTYVERRITALPERP